MTVAFDMAGVLDIEFDGEPLEGGVLRVVGWRDKGYDPADMPEHVLNELADPSIPKITFTLADHRWLCLAGWNIKGPIIDVQTQCWTVDETTDLDLDTCTNIYVPHAPKDKRIVAHAGHPFFVCDDGTEVRVKDAPFDQLAAYCERDLVIEHELFDQVRKLQDVEGVTDYWLTQCVPLSPVLLEMMLNGLPVDVDNAAKLCAHLETEIAEYERKLYDRAELPEAFKLTSDKQMREYLFRPEVMVPDRYRITKEQRAQLKETGDPAWIGAPDTFRITKVGTQYVSGMHRIKGRNFRVHKWTDSCEKKRGRHTHAIADGCNPSADSKTLQVNFGDDPWIADLLEKNKRETLVQTFLRPIPERQHNGRLYGEFVQTGTKTGRLASRRPNLQNQPSRGALGRAMRELFVAPEGFVFVHGDFSMLEPRIMAHLSQDPELLRIFRGGHDIYLETARMVFGRDFDKDSPERSLMKTYVLAMGYGAKALKLQETLAIAGFFVPLTEVQDTLDELMRVYARFFQWKEEVIGRATRDRYVLTIGGHKRHLGRDTNAKGWRDIGTGARQAVNSEIQGSAADIVNDLMIEAVKRLPLRLLVQVHDELLFQARPWEAAARVLQELQQMAEHGRYRLSVPLKFQPRIVHSWAEGKD
jgi:DNA polymerase I-like protein with 3'-5' exonuclease and polymerase domains